LLLGAALLSAGSGASDRGTFNVFQDGQEVGAEHFNVQHSGSATVVHSELDYTVGDKRVHQQSELNLGAGGDLQSYSWQEGRDVIEVSYKNGRVHSHYQPRSGKPQDFEYVMPPSTAIIDSNFYIDWQLLADRYDVEQGGTQQFQVFVPHEGDPDKVTLSSMGNAPGADGKPLLHLQATTSAATLDLYLEGQRLVRLEGPSLRVERAK
jgi:hypothetical protein